MHQCDGFPLKSFLDGEGDAGRNWGFFQNGGVVRFYVLDCPLVFWGSCLQGGFYRCDDLYIVWVGVCVAFTVQDTLGFLFV